MRLFLGDRRRGLRIERRATELLDKPTTCLSLSDPPSGFGERSREIPLVRLACPPFERRQIFPVERHADLHGPARSSLSHCPTRVVHVDRLARWWCQGGDPFRRSALPRTMVVRFSAARGNTGA